MSIEDIREVEANKLALKRQYKDIQNSPAMLDHVEWLETQEYKYRAYADEMIDDAYSRSMHLQTAITYGKVLAHLKALFADDVQQPKSK